MTNVSQSWQSIWAESIKHSSLGHGRNGLSERERLNMIAEVSLRNNGDRLKKKQTILNSQKRSGPTSSCKISTTWSIAPGALR
ncbi:MAG: hypothetical protein A4E49_00277 [Methanosaeta sp. PtaU1.Bin112]|nr:MAG: hypothetical protein A4E49_00277 [Methanosaeta sp. PtaU1.Bin112]